MTAVQDIMHVGVTAQAGALAGENIRLLKKKEITTKDMVSTGMKNIIGVRLIQLQSQVIGGL